MLTKEELAQIGISPKNHDAQYQRMSWDDYFMSLVNLLRKRSCDSQTQHACVAVRNKVIIGTGFNSFPSGSDDENLPNIRPYKYAFINHAEEALIYNCAKLGIALEGCTLYVSGQCCSQCIRKVISVGIKDLVTGPITHVSSSTEDLLYRYWVESHKVNVREYKGKVFSE